MDKLRISAISNTLLLLIAVTGASVAKGYVQLDSPNGGETLSAGEVFSITWQPIETCTMGDWDIWYCIAGEGTWQPVALDLYPGDTTPTGSQLSYDWTVPNLHSEAVLMVIRQDGIGNQWYDISDATFSIVPEPATIILLGLGSFVVLSKRRR